MPLRSSSCRFGRLARRFWACLTFLCVSSSSTDLPFKEPLNCRFPDPHFNAFIDLNGDCLADVFLTCQDSESSDRLSYQIWTNDKDGQFSLARKGDLPRGTKSVGFADMGQSRKQPSLSIFSLIFLSSAQTAMAQSTWSLHHVRCGTNAICRSPTTIRCLCAQDQSVNQDHVATRKRSVSPMTSSRSTSTLVTPTR